jgi:hypothetical protein
MDSYSLTNLPHNGILRVYATGERRTDESVSEHADAAERGYVDSLDERKWFWESRNDVEPVYEAHVLHLLGGGNVPVLTLDPHDNSQSVEDAHAEALDALRKLVGSLRGQQSDDGSTIYSTDADVDYATGDEFMYALHAHVKHFDALRGWVEDDVDILTGLLAD